MPGKIYFGDGSRHAACPIAVEIPELSNHQGCKKIRRITEACSKCLADPERLELPTPAFEAQCSIHLSYGSEFPAKLNRF